MIWLVLRYITVINGQKSVKSHLSAFGIKRDCKVYFVDHFFAWVDINTAINKKHCAIVMECSLAILQK